MSQPVVSDSTCLIGLERVGHIHILPELFSPIMIPPEVEREFNVRYDWLQTETITDRSLVAALKMVVDDGEAEAIVLAKEKNCPLISDDKQARAVAKNLGIEIMGTVGVLIRAKNAGSVGTIKPIMDELQLNGFYLSDALYTEALRLSGE